MCCPHSIATECKDTSFLHHLSTTLWRITLHHFFSLQIAPTFSIPQRSVLAPINPILTYHPKRPPWHGKEFRLVATHYRCGTVHFLSGEDCSRSPISLLTAGVWMKISPIKYNPGMVCRLRKNEWLKGGKTSISFVVGSKHETLQEHREIVTNEHSLPLVLLWKDRKAPNHLVIRKRRRKKK